jgi:hypothetical protein
VIAVLASQLDPEAQALVTEWSDVGAAVLSAEDVCTPGWIFYPHDSTRGVAIVSGSRVKFSEIRGVVTRRPAIIAEELWRINSADRAYVASEANAFLVSWLSALRCRVVNRPTPNSLCGPAWDSLHWRAAAIRAGLAWDNSAGQKNAHTVVVCRSNALFARNQREKLSALRLARAANVEFLAVRMRRGKICCASVAPDLANEEVRAGLLKILLEAE